MPILVSLFAALAVVICLSASAQAEQSRAPVQLAEAEGYVAFPAAGVKLRAPAGFDRAAQFHGFMQSATGASVMISSMPGPFAEFSKGFNAEQMGKAGVNLRGKESTSIEGLEGVLMSATQVVSGVDFGKWLLAFGDSSKTVLVVATFPLELQAQLSELLKQALLSTRLDDTPPPDPTAAMGFTIQPSGGLQVVQKTGGIGKVLMYALGGKLQPGDFGVPVFIAAPSLGRAQITDRLEFARQRLMRLPLLTITAEPIHEPIEIDGMQGFHMVAKAKHQKSGGDMAVYQAMLFDEGGYILMIGRVGLARGEEFVTVFEAMARSLTRR